MTPADLHSWRVSRGLTLDQAAALFRVSRRTYAYWEAGKTRGKFTIRDIPGLAELAWCEVERRLEKNPPGSEQFR